MGYDVVGIVVSGPLGPRASDGPGHAAGRDRVGEKWAHRVINFGALSLDPVAVRRAHAASPTGVAAVCALVEDRPVGMVTASLGVVSLEPALASVCVPTGSVTWARLRDQPRLGVSLLAEGQEATQSVLSGPEGDRFRTVGWRHGSGGSVLIHDASSWLDCSVRTEVAAGDHVIVLLTVHGLRTNDAVSPLVWPGPGVRRLDAS